MEEEKHASMILDVIELVVEVAIAVVVWTVKGIWKIGAWCFERSDEKSEPGVIVVGGTLEDHRRDAELQRIQEEERLR